MTERTLREQIAELPVYAPDLNWPTPGEMIQAADGEWISRRHVLRILDAHTAAQPAPDAVAGARDRPRCRPEHYADAIQCASCGRAWGDDGPEECPMEVRT